MRKKHKLYIKIFIAIIVVVSLVLAGCRYNKAVKDKSAENSYLYEVLQAIYDDVTIIEFEDSRKWKIFQEEYINDDLVNSSVMVENDNSLKSYRNYISILTRDYFDDVIIDFVLIDSYASYKKTFIINKSDSKKLDFSYRKEAISSNLNEEVIILEITSNDIEQKRYVFKLVFEN